MIWEILLQVKERAVELSKAMEKEDGVDGAVKAFLKHLPANKNKNKPDTDMDPPPAPSHLCSISRCFGCS